MGLKCVAIKRSEDRTFSAGLPLTDDTGMGGVGFSCFIIVIILFYVMTFILIVVFSYEHNGQLVWLC